MDIAGAEFWQAVVGAAAGEALRRKCHHLESCTVALEIGGQRHAVEFHKGSVVLDAAPGPRGAQVVIRGPIEEWERLIGGEIHYMRAINGLHGRLRLDGDLLVATWAGPALCELVRVAVQVRNGVIVDG